VFEDDFCRDRNYFPYLGPHWIVISPGTTGEEDEYPGWSWWIDLAACPDPPGYLIEDGNPGAILLCRDRIPKGENNQEGGGWSRWMLASYKVFGAKVGDTYSLILDWHWTCLAGGNYRYLEYSVEFTSSSTVELNLLVVDNDGETVLESCTLTGQQDPGENGIDFTLLGCVSHGAFSGFYGNDTIVADAVVTDLLAVEGCDPEGGWRAGIKHKCDRPVVFSYWYLTQLNDDRDDCVGCGFCDCDRSAIEEGDTSEVAPNLMLTFIAESEGETENDCSGLNGLTLLLKGTGCTPTSWVAYIAGDCWPCLKPIHVADLGLGADYVFKFELKCGGDTCGPGDPNFFDGFILQVSVTQNIASTSSQSYLCPTKPWVFLDGYSCDDYGGVVYEADEEVVPCPTGFPFDVSLNAQESTCKPLLLVFDYAGTMTLNLGFVFFEDPLEGCAGEDCEPCCHPCTFIPSVIEEPEMPPGPAYRVCQLDFRAIITEAPGEMEDPCPYTPSY